MKLLDKLILLNILNKSTLKDFIDGPGVKKNLFNHHITSLLISNNIIHLKSHILINGYHKKIRAVLQTVVQKS